MDMNLIEPTLVAKNSTELTFSLPARPPATSPFVVRISGTVSVAALGRDQFLVLALNNDTAPGKYAGFSIDFAPGYHGDVVRSVNNGFIVGYTGWGKDADIVFDAVMTVGTGFARAASGSYTTIHSDGRQYISQIGGNYIDKVSQITDFKLFLPSGGSFNGGKLMVSIAA